MSKFTKDNIGDKVIHISQIGCSCSSGTIFDLRKAYISDVTVAGDKARIYYGGAKYSTVEVETTSPYNTIFKNFIPFWDWITKTVFERISMSKDVYGNFKLHGDGDQHRLTIDTEAKPNSYGHKFMLDTCIKYGEEIPKEYYMINVKQQVKKWFEDYCGKESYSEDKTTEWGQCINCGSDDMYFEYENTDNSWDEGTYEAVWKCSACGAKTRQVYKLSKDTRSLEEE